MLQCSMAFTLDPRHFIRILKTNVKKRHLYFQSTYIWAKISVIQVSQSDDKRTFDLKYKTVVFKPDMGTQNRLFPDIWYIGPVTTWHYNMPSHPHFSSWKRKIIPKETIGSVLFLCSSDQKRTCCTVFCSNIETNLHWHVVALLENDGGRGSVEIQAGCWSEGLDLKTVACFRGSMLLSQLPVAASGRVVVLPVLISHLRRIGSVRTHRNCTYTSWRLELRVIIATMSAPPPTSSQLMLS